MKNLHYGLHVIVLSLFVVSAIGYGFLTVGNEESRDVMVTALTNHSCIQSQMPASSVAYKMHSCSICMDHSLSARFGSTAVNGVQPSSSSNTLQTILAEVDLPSVRASIVAWVSQYVPDSYEPEPVTDENEVYVFLFGK